MVFVVGIGVWFVKAPLVFLHTAGVSLVSLSNAISGASQLSQCSGLGTCL